MSSYEKVDAHMRRMVEGAARSPVGSHMDFRIVGAGRGEATYEMPVRRELTNPIGLVQGGVVTVLADAAMASATTTVLTDEEYDTTAVTTVDVFARFLGSISLAKHSLMRAQAKVVRSGGRLVWAECDLLADDRLVGKFTGTGIKVRFEAKAYTYDTANDTKEGA